jgi:ABC-type uncharacterized transport system permease subunit
VALRRGSGFFPYALGAFVCGALLQVVSVVETAISIGRFPVDNFFESVSLCALLLAITFLSVYWRYRFASLSVFVFPLVFLMTMIGSMEMPVPTWPNTSLRDAWLLVHVVTVLLGYVGILVTALASLFYLIQERQLKSKLPSNFFDRLPALATLDTLIGNAMGAGFIFITIGVIAGSAWAFIESGTGWISEPKIGLSLFTWACYLVMVFLRVTAGWRGRKTAVLALMVLGCSAITWATHVGLRAHLSR